jgi:hypothetical protein
MILIKINPSYYTMNGTDFVGWSSLSPYKNLCPDYKKFVLCIGKSADVAIKTNYEMNSDLGGSRSISVNHIGCELNDSMFHSLVNNPNQYDYIVQVMDHIDRGHIVVYHDGVLMTTSQVAHFSI